MTPEERQVIAGIFERLQAAESHPRDPEAEKLIADLVARQPYAPYAMAQSIYVNEQALANLHQRVEALEQQLQEARDQEARDQEAREQAEQDAQTRAQPQSGGFLSSLFGGSTAAPPPGPAQMPPPRWGDARPGYASAPQSYPTGGPMPTGPMSGVAPQPGPWGGQPQGGGFLQNAMTTAAGVAGGMVLANVLTNAFTHQAGSGLGSGLGTGLGSFGSSGTSLPGLGGTEATSRQDTSVQDSGGNGNTSDRDRPVDASYERSGDGSQSDVSPGGEPDNDAPFDDPGSFDDPGFSGDV
jgi:uncharacterized protein